MNISQFTSEYLRSRFRIDKTGEIRWIKSDTQTQRWNSTYANRIAGTKGGRGYRRIYLDGIRLLGQHIVWKMCYGVDPAQQVIHLDGNKANNHIHNLKDVSHREAYR